MSQPPFLVVLDRDGVINHDSPNYILSPEAFEPISGSLEAITALNRAGIPVAIATNQSAIGRGLLEPSTLEAIHRKLTNLLAELGGRIDFITFCPHAPREGCGCRKPAPGMLEAVARQFGVPCRDLVFVGDSATDMGAATAAGARGLLVRTGNGEEHLAAGRIAAETPVFQDLREVVGFLLEGEGGG